ncbi:hypothetical protein, partial [Bacillus cereus]|uniref:hypothetical protein n=1 Tax=Bacillus cereus TaxID=1396 RepID=UPI001C54DEB3
RYYSLITPIIKIFLFQIIRMKIYIDIWYNKLSMAIIRQISIFQRLQSFSIILCIKFYSFVSKNGKRNGNSVIDL